MMFISPTRLTIHFGNQNEKPQVRKTYSPLFGNWGGFVLRGDTYWVELKNPQVAKSYKKASKIARAAATLADLLKPEHQRIAPHEVRHPSEPCWLNRDAQAVKPKIQRAHERLISLYEEICHQWVDIYKENMSKQSGFSKASEDEFSKALYLQELKDEQQKWEQALQNVEPLTKTDPDFKLATDL